MYGANMLKTQRRELPMHGRPPPTHQRKQAEDCRRKTWTSLRGPPLDEAPPARKLEEKSNFPEGPAQDLHACTLFLPSPLCCSSSTVGLIFWLPFYVHGPIRRTSGNGSRPTCLLSHCLEESSPTLLVLSTQDVCVRVCFDASLLSVAVLKIGLGLKTTF